MLIGIILMALIVLSILVVAWKIGDVVKAVRDFNSDENHNDALKR